MMAISGMYAYSNARTKAMESKLISSSVMGEISKMDNVDNILARLIHTDYKPYIEEFGGMPHAALIDLALSRSLAESTQKLMRITPSQHSDIVTKIVGRWDIYNIDLILYAKSANRSYDSISTYLINSVNFNETLIRDAMAERSVEGAITRLMQSSSAYRGELQAALEAFRKTGNLTESRAAIDKVFYDNLGGTLGKLSNVSAESARVVRLDIEMRNILTLLRAKKYKVQTKNVADLLISNGITSKDELVKIYDSAKDMGALTDQIKSFDLKKAYSQYESSKVKQMLLFEIEMRNHIFKRAISLLRHSVLSFAVIIGYFYLKEIEVFTLRILVKGKLYGLSAEELNSMIGWQI